MYRETLENYAKENKWVKIQPPAQMQDIKKAEEYVGHPFPDELVKLLLELNGDKWLILSTEEIIETAFNTREYLSECYEDIQNHIFFAGNGCGDYYCYNVSVDGIVEEENIYIWEHEDNVCRLVAKNIEEMIRRYINDEI